MAAQDGSTLARLVGVMRRLLAPDGCPWDREQSFETLRKYALEEACEVIDAIDSGDRAALREELGDLLLQVVFQAELGRREGSFAIDDVIAGIVDKLVQRHPHVFGDVVAKDSDAVLRNWEKLKTKEKGERPVLGGRAAEHAGAGARAAGGREGRRASASTGRTRAGRGRRSPRSSPSSTRPCTRGRAGD